MKQLVRAMSLTSNGVPFTIKVYDDGSCSCILEIEDRTTIYEGNFTQVHERVLARIKEYAEKRPNMVNSRNETT